MQEITIGPAGIPLSVKNASTIVGIEEVAKLGLQSMEIEFVRGVYMGPNTARSVGKTAKKLEIKLSVHAPYFINLPSPNKLIVEASKKRILDSVERAHLMEAKIVVVHAGYYGEFGKQHTYQRVKEECSDIIDIMNAREFNDVILGLETSGRIRQWGSLEEVIQLCSEVDGCLPIIDFAHIYARNAGNIGFDEMLDSLSSLKMDRLYSHFSCISFSPVKLTGEGNEKYHLPLSCKKPDFEPLVKGILERKININMICESPLLDIDALVMKQMFEENGYVFK